MSSSVANQQIDALVSGAHSDPFSILGPHEVEGGLAIRVLRPAARAIDIVVDRVPLPSVERHADGFFEAILSGATRDGTDYRVRMTTYENATVEARSEFSQSDTHVAVTFVVREGPRMFVDHVLIVGNVRTSAGTIERELQVQAGDPFSLSAINESQRRLAALGLFRRARISELRHGGETTRDLLVTIEEAPATTVGYGGGAEVGRVVVAPEGHDAGGRRMDLDLDVALCCHAAPIRSATPGRACMAWRAPSWKSAWRIRPAASPPSRCGGWRRRPTRRPIASWSCRGRSRTT